MKLIHERRALRRAEITDATGLNKSTVLSLVDELVSLGLVSEADAVSDGTRGRPSAIVTANARGVVAVVSEIAVERARLAVIGLGGEVFQAIDVDINPSSAGPTATAAALGEASVDLLIDRPAVIGSATAVHGLVTLDGRLAIGPNLGWADLDLDASAAQWQPEGLPVFFGNDGDLGALGEHRRGGRGVDDMLYLSAERGIGGGLIRNGELQTGVSGFGSEVGHLIVHRGGTGCACGSHGCLETEIGASALLRKAGRRISNRRGAEGVLGDAGNGDEKAKAAVDDVAGWLGFAIGNLVNILDPGLVVCGGYLAEVTRIAREKVVAAARDAALMAPGRRLNIVPSTLGADAALVGASELVFDHALDDPAALSPRLATMKESA